ncbi:hypothetical protein AB0J80_36195 [Actinoplanes sp. NPDC049548]|uniref:hypothetical protein n=1 Tax=Actinoplanes sp. NPDC049548 TaxID=3155152 RepID=UPI00341617C3
MGVNPIKRHRENGGFWPTISDVELDKAFGLNDITKLVHGDLAYVREIGGRERFGAIKLGQYRDHDGDGEDAYWAFFGTDITLRADEAEVIRKVTVIWA